MAAVPRRQRTRGMLVLGMCHIAFGAVGTLASCAFLLAGVALLVPAHLFSIATGPLAASGTSHKVATAVGIFLLGITHAIASVTLIVAGVRVFDVARSARRLSMVAAFMWTFANVVEFFAFGAPIWWFMLMNAYPVVVELLFLRADWRAAFSAEELDDARAPLTTAQPPRPSNPPTPPPAET